MIWARNMNEKDKEFVPIFNIVESDNAVYADVVYGLFYDKRKCLFSCECTGNSQFGKECKHIKAFKKLLGLELKS